MGTTLSWLKLLSFTGATQVLVQAISFMCGILVVRLLPTDEYAFYTLANTMLGTMTMLADGGISTGVMAQGGRVWMDKKKFGGVLATGLQLRKQFAVFSLLISVPVLVVLLKNNGASWITTLLITVSIIPAFLCGLTGHIFRIGPELHQEIVPLQRISIFQNSGRLIITALFIFIFPFAGVAILASGIAEVYANLKLKRLAVLHADYSQNPDEEVRSEILETVKRIMPGAIYYSFSSQITIWVISIFGSTESLAQIGALNRLAMVLSVFTATFAILVKPRFARLPQNEKSLLGYFLALQAGLLLVAASIVFVVWFFPQQALWILGADYSDLTEEVFLLAAGSAIGLVSSGIGQLCASRGYLFKAHTMIGVGVFQNLMILTVDYTSLRGVLFYSILVSILNVAYNNIQFLANFREKSDQKVNH